MVSVDIVTLSCKIGIVVAEETIKTDFAAVAGAPISQFRLLNQSESAAPHHVCVPGPPKSQFLLLPESEEFVGAMREPVLASESFTLVAFADDASVIGGYEVETVLCEDPSGPGLLYVARRCYGLTTKNESHNHPTMYQPFQGAATGAGGLLRDLKVVGRGGLITSTSTAYCTARPAIQGLGWVESPTNKTGATDIIIGASNGASAYTNCEGFAATMGLLNTFEQIMPSGDKVGYRKPIMQAGGFGKIDLEHLKAQPLQVGQKVCVLGGANFRVGIGGASASSQTGGEIDLNVALASVQRGDPEMQRRVYEVVKALVGMGKGNIIVDAHDMGAGGNAGCLSEIAEKEGARYYVQAFRIGDVTLDLIEFWINESQERIALVVNEADLELLLKVARRHNCPCDVVGEITGDGVLTLHDDEQGDVLSIELARFLGSERRKRIEFESWQPQLLPLALPERTLQQHFERHLRHPKSGSKRFLVTKADRSVLGRTARQQCVGPWGLTVSDFAIEALTELRADSPGQAKSMAEAAVAGLIDPEEMVRLTVAEAVMNLMGARITKVTDISLQANWMAPAKLTARWIATCARWRPIAATRWRWRPSSTRVRVSLPMAAKTATAWWTRTKKVTMFVLLSR
jgi:phosphoribosylformylglycinamidine synthase